MARRKKEQEETDVIMETEKSESSKSLKEKVSKFAKIFFGIIFVLGGLFLIWLFLPEFVVLLKGILGVIVILIGILLIFLGWSD
jgi:amino acid transporter